MDQGLGVVVRLAHALGKEVVAADIAKESFKTGKTIRQIAMERKLMSDADLGKILDPKRMTQPQADVIGSGGG